MRVLFWGTPEFSIPPLLALMGEGHEVVGVVTRPDQPAGRGRKLRTSPVKAVALAESLPVLTPDRPRGEAFLETLRALRPEISVVVAYGHILPVEILGFPERGSINVHASLLPELRGAAPVNWAIVRGHRETGITIMQMTAGMDEGPILLQRPTPIDPEDSATSLYLRLAELGAEALIEALAFMEAGVLEPVEQDHDRANYAPKVDRETARIDWSRPAREVADHIRGMDRAPGAWTTLGGEPVKLFRPTVEESAEEAPPGTILEATPEAGLRVRAGEGSVRIGEVQPAGKRIMETRAWLRGAGPRGGQRFE